MNYITDINLKNTNNTYNVIIEIPIGTNNKLELAENTFDTLVEVRKVYGKYPFYYGCFPQTLAEDHDALDMILLSNRARSCLDIVAVQPIGIIKTIDAGAQDDKIIVIPADEELKNINKLEKRAIHFLSKYKGKNSKMILDTTIYDVIDAISAINTANNNYITKNTTFNITSF